MSLGAWSKSPPWRKWAGPNLESPIKAEPLAGFLRHFVGRETATFSTVMKYKEVSVSFNFHKFHLFQKQFFLMYKKLQTFRIANCTTLVTETVKVVKLYPTNTTKFPKNLCYYMESNSETTLKGNIFKSKY